MTQPLTLLAGGHLVGVHVCEVCGAAIVQRASDPVDRAAQHRAWHQQRSP